MKRIITLLAVCGVVLSAGSLFAADAKEPVCPAPAAATVAPKKLQAGDKAPVLKVLKWVKGQPVAKFAPGQLYVVEFWATWCPPCRQSIPHMTELAKEHKGKINFIGVCIWDSTDLATRKAQTEKEYVDKVSKFVKEQGDNMVYNVALDDLKGTMSDTWMRAAERPGIPSAFVVGKDGKLLAICHPMELDPILEQITAGKFDAKAFAKKQAEDEAKAAELQKIMENVSSLFEKNQFKEAMDVVDKAIASNPETEGDLGVAKFYSMLRVDEPAAYAYAKKIADGIYKDSVPALHAIAATINDATDLKSPDYQLALSVGEKADAAAQGKEPMVLSVLASLNAKLGQWDKAVELQQKAIDGMIKASGNSTSDTVKKMQETLAAYKEHKAA